MWQDKLYIALVKFLVRLFGLGASFFAIVILLSLFSFNASDASFNTASTNEQIQNWMGSFGSHTADLLFQLIGLSAFFLCLILFNLGIRIASKEKSPHMWTYLALKLVLTPFCLLCFSLFFATIKDPDWWIFNSLGGVNGKFILAKLSFAPIFATGFLSLILSLLLLSIILEISISDWRYFFRYSIITSKYLWRIFSSFINKIYAFIIQKKAEIAAKLKDSESKAPKGRKLFFDENIEEENNQEESEEEDLSENEKLELIEEEKPKAAKSKKVIKSFAKPGNYNLPTADLLIDRSSENKDKKVSQVQLDQQSKMLLKVLEDYGVFGSSLGVKLGPVITLHEFEPTAGTKSSRIIGLADDIARSMSAVSTRIAVIPGKNSIGIELPNQKREMIFLREMVESKEYKYTQAALPIILGKDIAGEPMVVDLAKMPHLLIAGTTGSGKSVGVNAMILSLLYKLSPEQCKFIMIDPKMLELSVYDGIPHLLSPVVTEPGRAVIALKWITQEMEERYRLMSSLGVRNIAGYNEKIDKALKNGEKISKQIQTGFDAESGEPIMEEMEFEAKRLPFIVVIVDEMADLMLVAGKEIESSVQRIAQMARAAGIHLIMATQRPSVDVITGVIKANFPTRISFQVTSRIDSRTILGVQGAEQLLGQGDMIYMSGGSKLTRVHAPFCSDGEVENVVNFIAKQKFSGSEDNYGQNVVFEQLEALQNKAAVSAALESSGGDGTDGDLYEKAVAIVKRDRKPSISYVQRQLRIGYNRAAILIERMEKEGVITPPSVSGKRELIEE